MDRKSTDRRNKRRDKQKQRDYKRYADDWEDYANKQLLEIGEDYPYQDWEEEETYSRDFE